MWLSSIKHRLQNFFTPRKSREELHRYWSRPDDGRNQLPGYIKHVERSEFFFSFFKKYANPQDHILEIGSNVGRNLNYLFFQGFKNLEGIEISQQAVDAMKETYSEMAKVTPVFVGPVEDAIKNMRDDSFDVVFTLATFMHLHYDSEWVFAQVARITKKYLITIEDEQKIFFRHFPRNYKKIFEKLGFIQLEEFQCGQTHGLTQNYWLRVFKKA